MSEYRTITISKGPGGYGGPLTLTPTDKKNKIVYIVGGGMKPDVVDRIAGTKIGARQGGSPRHE